MVRHADDFIVTGRTQELLESEVKPLVVEFFKARGLELSREKTRITHIEEGFDLLGQNVRKYNGKLLIRPSRKNVKNYLVKVRTVIKANKQATTGGLIALLNPIIRGWAYYHRHVVSSATFRRVDSAIFDCLWRWARRRHRNKPSRWIYRKYFERLDGLRCFFRERSRDDELLPNPLDLCTPDQTAAALLLIASGLPTPCLSIPSGNLVLAFNSSSGRQKAARRSSDRV